MGIKQAGDITQKTVFLPKQRLFDDADVFVTKKRHDGCDLIIHTDSDEKVSGERLLFSVGRLQRHKYNALHDGCAIIMRQYMTLQATINHFAILCVCAHAANH